MRFAYHAVDGGAHEDGLIGKGRDLQLRRQLRLQAVGTSARMPLTMFRVEALPVLMIESSDARWPSTRTMLVCGGKPLRTWATSCMYTIAPFTWWMGRSFSPSMVVGALLVSSWYSNWPILMVPEGRIRFCAPMAFDHVGRRETFGLQRRQVQIDQHLALLAAVGIRNAGARHGDELRADEVEAKVVQLHLRETLAGKPELNDGHAGSVVLDDQRRRRSLRQLPDLGLAMAVTCATALPILTPGWKKILTTERLFTDIDSMCSMSLTVVVRERSLSVTMRSAICSGEKPWYCQMMETTGMLMLGKISTGMFTWPAGPSTINRSATTAKV